MLYTSSFVRRGVTKWRSYSGGSLISPLLPFPFLNEKCPCTYAGVPERGSNWIWDSLFLPHLPHTFLNITQPSNKQWRSPPAFPLVRVRQNLVCFVRHLVLFLREIRMWAWFLVNTAHSHKNACAAFTNLRGGVFVFARIDWINSRMLFFYFFFTSFRGNALRQCLKCVLPQRAYN